MLLFYLTLRNIIMVELESPPRAQRREKSTLFTFIFRYFFTMQRCNLNCCVHFQRRWLLLMRLTDWRSDWFTFDFFFFFMIFNSLSTLLHSCSNNRKEAFGSILFVGFANYSHTARTAAQTGLEHQTTHCDTRVRLRCLYGRDARCI